MDSNEINQIADVIYKRLIEKFKSDICRQLNSKLDKIIAQNMQNAEKPIVHIPSETGKTEIFFTAEDAMAELGCNPKTLYNLSKRYPIKAGGKYNRNYVPSEIAKLKEKRRLSLR